MTRKAAILGGGCNTRDGRTSERSAVREVRGKVTMKYEVVGLLALLCGSVLAETEPSMKWADETRTGRPYAKDPSVVRLKGRYLMYFSLPPFDAKLAPANAPKGW